MRRFIGLGLVLALPVAGTLAAPRPKAPATGSPYFPAQVGAKWVYDGGGADWTWTVTSVQPKDGETLVTVSMLSPTGYPVPLERLAISAKGMYVLEVRNGPDMVKLDPP